ncbi:MULTISPECIES: NAD(P)H-dependent oxidoreductase [unclassified Alteromonas]|uniref:NAD(P)H-dependent oxidoreductase n=1 Tax=unclassified Alteromonas TaxID=2614992 RepID=UPI001921BAF4|nr:MULTISPECIES: NAD(P)H-dependent oxidoreductase [unclassified Alteromonas]WDT87644.1 NAD(P)H-dependent oxidoreductase [Alteromonas sp. 009811495]BCO18672.1 flavodoxin [Alteromonas sp. KC3]BCO22633.1 flavodoxin [Alteromonas sp. KC14]
MKNVLIINAHQYYPFSEGRLNSSLVDQATSLLTQKGYDTRHVNMLDEVDVQQQLELHQWADIILLQSPINWMGVPWSFKKYMDEVYTAGMGGALCNGDGRSADEPKKGYGTGGTLKGKKYMMSVTFNAPEESFNDDSEYLFQGKSVDDLLFPMHANFRFFGMEALPTFAAFDVMKNADVENDFKRFEAHIKNTF